MHILITGYKGFIGQNMVKGLEGHDLTLYEPEDGYCLLDGVDRVIHLGAISQTTCTDWAALVRYNYKFTVDLIQRCQNRRIPLQIASSASVYGIENSTFRESDPCAPANLYAMSKRMVEEYVERIKLKSSVQLFRYFNVYGPHEDHKGNQASPFHKFKQQAKTGKIELFAGSEHFCRDFIPVEEIINLHQRFFDVDESGIWNFGTGKTITFLEIAKMIAKDSGAEVVEIPMPEELLNTYQKFTKADICKLNKTLYNHGKQ